MVFEETFRRTAAAPESYARTFAVAKQGALCVTVENGDETARSHISVGRVEVDGDALFGPSDFAPNVDILRATRDVGAGNHLLDVTIASGAGAFIHLPVRFRVRPTYAVVSADRLFEVLDLFHSSAVFAPNIGHIVLGTRLSLRKYPAQSMAHELVVRAQFEILSDSTCGLVRTLENEVLLDDLSNGDPITVSWDGRDSQDVMVASGTYLYRATLILLRRTGLPGFRGPAGT